MGQRELAIVAKARDTLNDTDSNNYRWSDKKLMEHLNDAQDAMCREISLLVKRVSIITAPGIETYYMPSDTVRALNCKSAKQTVPFISAEELDEQNTEWEEKKGSEYEYIVVNQLNQLEIRPYPLPSTTQTNGDNLTLHIRYSAMPLELGWNDTTSDSVEQLQISPMWDFALRHYVIGMAFLDYGDESSLQRSVASMQFYGIEITRAKKLSKKAFAKRVVTTPYQAKVTNNEKLTRRGQRYGS